MEGQHGGTRAAAEVDSRRQDHAGQSRPAVGRYNRRLPANPAQRIVIDLRHKASETKRSFSDVEAAIVLRAASREQDPVRRWVPWLCAYSGARLRCANCASRTY
jgi:hypothetical protein